MEDIDELNRMAVELQEEARKNTSLWKENFLKAKKLLENALESDPGNVTTLTNLGATLCDMGEHEIAKQYLKKAISLGSIDRNTYFNLGVACINTRSEYMEYFSRAGKLIPGENTWDAYFDPHAH